MAQQTYITVKDNRGIEHKWLVEEEMEKTYKVFSNGIITSIYKCGCYTIDGKLYSFEKRNNDYPNYDVLIYEDGEVEYCDVLENEDRSIDLGYLEDDIYGLDIIYDEEGNAYGL